VTSWDDASDEIEVNWVAETLEAASLFSFVTIGVIVESETEDSIALVGVDVEVADSEADGPPFSAVDVMADSEVEAPLCFVVVEPAGTEPDADRVA